MADDCAAGLPLAFVWEQDVKKGGKPALPASFEVL
jgi:hypothetical protein